MGNTSAQRITKPSCQFDELDATPDDKITLAELVSFSQNRISVSEDRLKEYFSAMDRSKKGYLTALEYETLATILRQELEDAGPLSTQQVVIEGVLIKRENARMTKGARWSKKYVRCLEINDPDEERVRYLLQYYASASPPTGLDTPRKTLEASKCHLVLSVPGQSTLRKSRAFSIVYETGYEMVLCCASSREWSEWTSALIPLMSVEGTGGKDSDASQAAVNIREPVTAAQDQITLRERSSRGVDGIRPNASWSDSASSESSVEGRVDEASDTDIDDINDSSEVAAKSAEGESDGAASSVGLSMPSSMAARTTVQQMKKTSLTSSALLGADATPHRATESKTWLSAWKRSFMSGDEAKKGYLNSAEAVKVLRETFDKNCEAPRSEHSRASANEVVQRVALGTDARINFDLFLSLIREMSRFADVHQIPSRESSSTTATKKLPRPSVGEANNVLSSSSDHSLGRTNSATTSTPGSLVLSFSTSERERSQCTKELVPSSSVRFLSVDSKEPDGINRGDGDINDGGTVRYSSVDSNESNDTNGGEDGINDGRSARVRSRRRQQQQCRSWEGENTITPARKLLSFGADAIDSAHMRNIAGLKKSALQVKALDNDPRSIKLLEKQYDEMTRKLSARDNAYKKQLIEEVFTYKEHLRDFTRVNTEMSDDLERLATSNCTQHAELEVAREQLAAMAHDNLSLQAEVHRLQFILRHLGVNDGKFDGEPHLITLSSLVSMLEDNRLCFRAESDAVVASSGYSDSDTARHFITHLPPNLRLIFSANRYHLSAPSVGDADELWTRHEAESTGQFYYFNIRTGESRWQAPGTNQRQAVKLTQQRKPGGGGKYTRGKVEA